MFRWLKKLWHDFVTPQCGECEKDATIEYHYLDGTLYYCDACDKLDSPVAITTCLERKAISR